MKRNIFIVCILFAISLFPQERKFVDTPFGGGGGYAPGWYIFNLDPINQKLNQVGIPELRTSGIYSSGGGGFIYLGLIPQLRIGGMGFGGLTSVDAVSGGVEREARYSFGGGGLTIEYTLPFVKRVGISVGALIGAASQNLEIYKNNESFSWDDIWNEIGSADVSGSYGRILENNYWILSPTLNIDIPLYRFFIFRIGAGYNFSLGNNWKVENDKDLGGVPTDVNGDSFFIQSGIFIGFFSF